MIRVSDGKIGSREVFVIVTFMISVEISDFTPTFLFKDGKTATWMIPVLAGLTLILPFLVLTSLLKKYRNKGLIDVIYLLLGKYAGFVINIILFLIIFLALIANTRNYVNIIQTMFLPMTPNVVLYVILIAGACFIASRGLEVMGRTIWVLYLPIVFVLVLIVLLVLGNVNISNLFPLLGSGLVPIIKTSVVNSPIVADIFLLSALYHQVRSHKEFKYPVLLGYASSIILLMVFFAIYIGVYDYPSVNYILFPFQQLTMLINTGRYVINFEAFYLFFWVIASVVRYAIYLYLTAAIFSYTLKMKEFEPLILPLSALTILLGMIPKNMVDTQKIYRENILLQGTWLIFILLPFLLWFASVIRGGKKNEAQ